MKVLYSLIAALVLCGLAQSAQAVNCVYINGNKGFIGTFPLQISTLSVPRDAPVGTVLYRQNFSQTGGGYDTKCLSTGGAATMNTLLVLKSIGANTGYSTGPYANFVYQTGVAGIGVAWVNGTSVQTAAVRAAIPNGCTLSGTVDCSITGLKIAPATGMVLIKTGPVGTGTINGSSLGTLEQDVTVNDGGTIRANSVGLTGSINIVALTCMTSDVNVPMGTNKIASFSGIGSASTPVNFMISLTGCPGFPGYYGNASSIPTSSQSAVISAGTLVPNTLSLRLDPVGTPIDASNGVLSLSAAADPATGVGLQVLDASGAPWALSQNKLLNLPIAAGTTSLNIPLSARYIQTATTVTAGSANAVANYTIIYQ
ncbi:MULTISPECIES: fimbrial protein [unclassified Pseudomonas]|jgi:type 1 fimbria pilin|uniref:fimbrial protein n=1 Tax=unclassified Pseudomonas TaxID=196821 RepID=UPI000289D897|nr:MULTISPECIES: fimbrial protein [unclassified Pseudomonas]QJI37853.1 fimbrial protein [Pseudomonas sp. ADAK13]